jgi:hypothetical protein
VGWQEAPGTSPGAVWASAIPLPMSSAKPIVENNRSTCLIPCPFLWRYEGQEALDSRPYCAPKIVTFRTRQAKRSGDEFFGSVRGEVRRSPKRRSSLEFHFHALGSIEAVARVEGLKGLARRLGLEPDPEAVEEIRRHLADAWHVVEERGA